MSCKTTRHDHSGTWTPKEKKRLSLDLLLKRSWRKLAMNEGPVVHIRKYLSFQLAAYFKSYLLSVPSKAFLPCSWDKSASERGKCLKLQVEPNCCSKLHSRDFSSYPLRWSNKKDMYYMLYPQKRINLPWASNPQRFPQPNHSHRRCWRWRFDWQLCRG